MFNGLPKIINYGNPANRTSPLNRGLVGWWKNLSQGRGGRQFLDLFKKNHGTFSGSTMPTWQASRTPGSLFGSISFGTGAAARTTWIAIPTKLIPADNTDLSLSIWFKHPTSNNFRHIFGFTQNGGGSGMAIYSHDSQVGVESTGGSGETTGLTLDDNRWHHAILTFNFTAQIIALYIDGKQELSPTSTGYSNLTGGGLAASVSTPLLNFDGHLDDARIYNRTLSDSEALLLYNAALTGYKREFNYLDKLSFGPKTTLLTSLISYWKLDETSGDAVDSHGINTLTETSGTIASTAGKIGTARDFEAGDTEHFLITDNTDLSTGDIDFTISFWVQFESFGGSRALVSKFLTTGNQREYEVLYLNGNQRLEFAVSNNGSGTFQIDANNLGTPATATWYFVVAWHDSVANTLNIQVNDGAVDSTAHTLGVFDGSAGFSLGARPDNTQNHDGLLDEVGFWKRVLTSQERTALYNNGAGLAYPFNASSSTTLRPKLLGNARKTTKYANRFFVPYTQ